MEKLRGPLSSQCHGAPSRSQRMGPCGPDRGLVGKGHMLMMKTNSDETARIIMAWLGQAWG